MNLTDLQEKELLYEHLLKNTQAVGRLNLRFKSELLEHMKVKEKIGRAYNFEEDYIEGMKRTKEVVDKRVAVTQKKMDDLLQANQSGISKFNEGFESISVLKGLSDHEILIKKFTLNK